MNYELCMHFKLFDGCVMYSITVCPPSARRRFLTELFDLLTQEMVASVNNGSFHRSRFSLLPHALNCRTFCFWRRQSVFCLYMKYLGNRWTDLHHIHTEDEFGHSLGRVWRSESKFIGQGRQGHKTAFSALPAACVQFMFGKHILPLVFFSSATSAASNEASVYTCVVERQLW